MLPDQHTHTVCTGITSPGAYKYEPYREDADFQQSCLVNVGQHHRHVKKSEKCRKYLLGVVLWIAKYQSCHLADQKCHKQHHKPDHLISRKLLLKIQKPIVRDRSNITGHPRRFLFDSEYFIKLCHADQTDDQQDKEKKISASDQSHKRNDHQKDPA